MGLIALLAAGCGGQTTLPPEVPTAAVETTPDRLRYNQLALRLNLPLYWASDANANGEVDAGEIAELMFYGVDPTWTRDGALTPEFRAAHAQILAAHAEATPEDARLAKVYEELSSAAPTLLRTDLSELPEPHKNFARHMLRIGELMDELYAEQVGMTALASQLPSDTASRSLFRRNWGAACRGATTESAEACSAIPGSPAQPVGVYPAAIQSSDSFCQTLEDREDSETLLAPFVVVRAGEGDALTAVPYPEAFPKMAEVAQELRAAAEAIAADPEEAALQAYLRAAAESFGDNNWERADDAWSRMSATNSKWYVRIAPDETYWDPCARKAGFHVTFALINTASLAWQERLTPIQSDMEGALAALAPDDYTAREVSFHMPDFIDIVVNSGDDRDPFGATIGQSLPNWGVVAEESRGRTVAMTNLYTDPDSEGRRRATNESLFTTAALSAASTGSEAGLMSTVLHEATHNLGPAQGYTVNDQGDDEIFGGPLAAMLEELKAQSGALFFVDMMVERGVLTEEQRRATYFDSIAWALGHISRGMYTPSGGRKAYSQLAAVQVGFLMDAGVITFNPEAQAHNGQDMGAFDINYDGFAAAAQELMAVVMHIKAAGDKDKALELANRYVDGDMIPMEMIKERAQRGPRGSFVFSVEL